MLRVTENEIAEIQRQIKEAEINGDSLARIDFKTLRSLLTDRDALLSDLRLAVREISLAKDSLALLDNSAALKRLALISERLNVPG